MGREPSTVHWSTGPPWTGARTPSGSLILAADQEMDDREGLGEVDGGVATADGGAPWPRLRRAVACSTEP